MTEISIKRAYAVNHELYNNPLLHSSGSFISVKDCFSETAVFPAVDSSSNIEEYFSVSLEKDPLFSSGKLLPQYIKTILALYKKYSFIGSIAYVRFPSVITLSSEGKSVPIMNKDHAVYFRYPIQCVSLDGDDQFPGKNPGEFPDAITATFEKHGVLPYGALLLKGNGAFVWHETPFKALDLCVRLKSIAENALSVQSSGDVQPAPMLSAEVKALIDEAEKMSASAREPGPIGSKVTVEQMKNIDLELLAYFDKTCRANGIKYSLTGGTLIGAVRHGGMIPWDDDIDVFLTRPEFEKLNSVFPENGRFQYYTLQKDPGFNYVFGRLIDTWTLIEHSDNTAGAGKGLFLDVCVVDGLPKNPALRFFHMKHMRLLVLLRKAMIRNPDKIRRGWPYVIAAKILRRVSSLRFWNKRMSRVMRLYPFDSSDYVGNFTSQYGDRELLHASVFDDYFDVQFENLNCMVCRGYEEYLKNIYGDYLILPPEEKRNPTHDSNAVWVGPCKS